MQHRVPSADTKRWLVDHVRDIILQPVGCGGYGLVLLVQWPDYTDPVIMKVNTDENALKTTIGEAAILEDLQGRAGAPRLIAVIPEFGVIVMEDSGRTTLSDMLM